MWSWRWILNIRSSITSFVLKTYQHSWCSIKLIIQFVICKFVPQSETIKDGLLLWLLRHCIDDLISLLCMKQMGTQTKIQFHLMSFDYICFKDTVAKNLTPDFEDGGFPCSTRKQCRSLIHGCVILVFLLLRTMQFLTTCFTSSLSFIKQNFSFSVNRIYCVPKWGLFWYSSDKQLDHESLFSTRKFIWCFLNLELQL